MFYLKYRPHTLEDIDNIKPREIISEILKQKNLPHAYLFIGQKGTGKTSTARIFAKAINCLSRKNLNPCNSCSNCLAIDASSSPDVTELDAASNRGINEVKELIKEAAFSPMVGKYRVYIIDEAHMITPDGFNALLKTLEEPPKTVIFILATTNLEKVPKTIVSRCLTVNFGKASKPEIKRMLKRIAVGEKISVDEKIFDLVASHSEKSFRDGAKLFEELVIQQKLTFEEAQKYLGIRSKQNLLEILSTKPVKDALLWIEEFSKIGGSYKSLIEELLEELHILLLKKNGVDMEDDLTINLSLAQIIFLLKSLNEAYNLLKVTPIESLPLEIAIVEFYNLFKKAINN